MNTISFTETFDSCRIFNTHSHHLPDCRQKELTLPEILQESYVSWCGASIPGSAAEAGQFLSLVGNRSYFIWLEKSLQELYAIKEPLSSKTWDEYGQKIKDAHKDADWHMKVLRESCRYEYIVQDSYWDPGDDNGHEVFRPAFRVNSFFFGYDKNACDHDGKNAQILYSRKISDIDEYTSFVRDMILEKKRKGCVGIKSAIAYDRPIRFGPATKVQAAAALRYEGTDGSDEDIVHFQDYIFDKICAFAAEFDLPFQIHTGMGQMNGTNAMQLQQAINSHPDTTFLLMHGGFPWTDDYVGLVHYYTNVYADICWLPLISPNTARRVMHELIEVCNADKVCWGCDTWTSEESYGALLALRETLTGVLSEKVASGYMDPDSAKEYIKKVLYKNAFDIFKV